ncbi:protein tesmin/TSO1-like CXC 2 isoform X2 [Primulina tabacum]|uniref:protein tesmin/TSO1-like CXC 2 isoform X2 n=1 Tax=Primulina tabacum TaxID=48773 RepID=UPI003F598E2F
MEMDSPESSKTSAIVNDAETVPAQESPIFSYISNLSPIQPFNAPSTIQGFPGLSSPPLVFTSPQLKPNSQQTSLKRTKFLEASTGKLCGQDEGGKKNITVDDVSSNIESRMSTSLVACTEKSTDSNGTPNDQIESPTEHPDQFLAEILNIDSVDLNNPSNSAIKKSEWNHQSADNVAGKEFSVKPEYKYGTTIHEEIVVAAPPSITRPTEEVHALEASADVNAAETDIKHEEDILAEQCLKTGFEPSVNHTLTNLDQGDSMNEVFHHRGIRKRCLQFEDAMLKLTSRPTQIPLDDEKPESLCLEIPPTPINQKPAGTIQAVLHPRSSLNSTLNVPKRTSFGLHLNSLFNSVQSASGATIKVKSVSRGNFSIWERNSEPEMNSVAESVTADADDISIDIHVPMVVSSSSSSSSNNIKCSNNSLVLDSIEDKSIPGIKRKFNTVNDGAAAELNKSNPKKKRKIISESSDGDGCKRCNCKKSKCLKLYCDCFAAGIYCAEPCACQGCLNRPEHVDTVLETRQQIETRNPLAFAPKVVQHIIEPPGSNCGLEEDTMHFTPSSARHKRGCNCKKSMCLKKYCECYQANVGCSDGCRCEGCKNVFGQKGEFGTTKDVLSDEENNEIQDASLVNDSNMLASGDAVHHTDFCSPRNSNPFTPEFQYLNHEKDAAKAWFPPGKYFLSPEPGLPSVPPFLTSPKSPRVLDNDAISETTKEILDLVSFDLESDYGNVETGNEISETHQEPEKTGLLSQRPDSKGWANNSVLQSSSRSELYSSARSSHFRCSPNTPVANFSGTKHQQVMDSDHDLFDVMQDDTPEILKDIPTPLNAVKVSSPNKKRVSPPHSQVPKFDSSSPARFRNAVKYILKSVPSFPPLTSCINSKSDSLEQAGNSQN